MADNINNDALRQKYESMSLDEMLAESNRQIQDIFKITPSIVQHHHAIIDQQQNNPQEISQPANEEGQLLQSLNTALSNNDTQQFEKALSAIADKNKALLNKKDTDGISPLIYATCFGKYEAVKRLIEAGADVDVQDNLGWSALMWAINNHHDTVAKLLLDHGASSETKSANGRTVIDFVNHSSNGEDIMDMIMTRDVLGDELKISRSISTTSQSSSNSSFSSNSSVATLTTKNDVHIAAAAHEDDLFNTGRYNNDVMTGYHHNKDAVSLQQHDDILNTGDDDADIFEFQWDKCLPDQMFVFNSNDLDYILDTLTTESNTSSKDTFIPANIIFLASRFAHNFSTQDLLDEIFDGFIDRISTITKTQRRSIHTLAYWLTNLTRLLFYLKKDSGLVVATADQQLNLSELIHEIYTIIIHDFTENSLSKLISPALLECEQITEMDPIEFTDNWYRFFRKSTSSNSTTHESHCSILKFQQQPQLITELLSSILSVLQSFEVHQQIVNQLMTQCFHYISCALFNHILTNKKFLCRSRAIQIRLNLSHLEEWIQSHHYNLQLKYLLNPVIHLLQLLQCLTQLTDLAEFINTTKDLDSLNLAQIRRVVLNYRYEVNEPKLPEEIEKYSIQCMEDTVKCKQKRSLEMASASAARMSITSADNVSIVSHSTNLSRNSMSNCSLSEMDGEDNSELSEQEEFKNAHHMLPFFIPTMNHLYNSTITPYIPQAWLDKLDKKQDKDVMNTPPATSTPKITLKSATAATPVH